MYLYTKRPSASIRDTVSSASGNWFLSGRVGKSIVLALPSGIMVSPAVFSVVVVEALLLPLTMIASRRLRRASLVGGSGISSASMLGGSLISTRL